MINQSKQWSFVNKPTRPALTEEQANYWRAMLPRLLKVGIEVELNLPDQKGTCHEQNFLCQCKAVFKAPNPIPNTNNCYEQCTKWNNGACEIAKNFGCNGIYCVEYEAPCSSCDKFDRGCSSCPERYDLRKDPKMVRKQISEKLQPTKFVGEVGQHGVYKVCRDGSLNGDGGVEVATAGRRVQFWSIHEMMKRIMDSCREHGAYVDERCSIHIHLLASYLEPMVMGERRGDGDRSAEIIRASVSELEEPVPEIILANFHQLVRRFQCALIWLSSSGDNPIHMTRWEKFRKSVIPYSALRNRMPQVVKEVSAASKTKPKYALMNYAPVVFENESSTADIKRLHVEARYMDGMLSPAVVAAHACLLYGLMLKAVEISKHGVLQTGDKAYMDEQQEMMRYLCNNDGNWDGTRHSDTSNIGPFIPRLVEQSKKLVRLVKHTLSDNEPADIILQNLAQNPVSKRRIAKKSWEEIEEELLPTRVTAEESLTKSMRFLIDTLSVAECDSENEWIEEVARQVAADDYGRTEQEAVNSLKNKIEKYISEKVAQNKIFWSRDLGSYTNS